MTVPSRRGYTLIELMVSVAIFSIVMLLATGAYLSLINAARHARATSVVMTNISSAVDTMARAIRTGSGYECNGVGDCTLSSPGSYLIFTDAEGDTVEYLLISASGTLGRCIAPLGTTLTCTQSSATPLTDPTVDITNLAFVVRGTADYNSGDYTEPNVVIIMQGSAIVPNNAPVAFSIETAATSRIIDIGT